MSVSNYTLNQRISNLQYEINKLQTEINHLQNDITQTTLIYSSTAIHNNINEPSTSLTIRNKYNYSGWFFKNDKSSNKINWSFPLKKNVIVSDLKGISISFFNGNSLEIPLITVITNNGSMTYVFNQQITPTINTNYQGVCSIDKKYVPFNNETQIQFQPLPFVGNFSQTDTIVSIDIGSYSSINAVEFVVSKLNLIYSNNITQSYLLVSP